MVEAVAEMDDELTHKYLEGETLTVEEIRRGLRQGTLATRIIPVLTGSALLLWHAVEEAVRSRGEPCEW